MTLAALMTGILLLPGGDRVARRPTAGVARPAATGISLYVVTPANVTFATANPSTTPAVAGSSAVTIFFVLSGGSSARTWNIQLKSSTNTFAGCTTVPVSAITATCGSVAGGTGGACASPFAMSPGGAQLATGSESDGLGVYLVTINFSLSDEWKYLPALCTPQTFDYILTAN